MVGNDRVGGRGGGRWRFVGAAGLPVPLAAVDLVCKDHRLGAAVDIQFLQDGRNMRLDGRFGEREFICDLFVGLSRTNQFHDPGLLRRQFRDLLTNRLIL